MDCTQRFERYLALFRLRLKQLAVARGAAILATAALIVTLAAVGIGVRTGFAADIFITARILLFALLIGLAVGFVILPNRHIEQSGAPDIERRIPAFAGRVETYVELQDTANSLREFLAEDTLRIADDFPPEQQIKQREFTIALSAAAVAITALIVLAIAAPGNYSYGVRHLWAGWLISGLLRPQSIEIQPGNDGIRKGGTVRVYATMQGFDPAAATMHASFGDSEWQVVEMTPGTEAFEFTFFSVRETLEYYVSAADIRSPTFRVNVVDLPTVEDLVLTYRFPEWTGREPETHDPGGDIRAIVGTEIELEIRADRGMTPAELVVNDQSISLDVDSDTGRAEFEIGKDGQYFVAAKVGGERIRLTDDYFITVVDDEEPEIQFARPGRDWSASSVEEVTARIAATDDFAIETLELHYSINGGDWESVSLPSDANEVEVDHVFFLEALQAGEDQSSLVPGDLISYYAVATDRDNSSSTDIFFVDVQPFDRRYSQSQLSGGMARQQGGQSQDEISSRQREIIVSTWNLIRERQNRRSSDDAYVADNAALLSRLQSTLRNQVQTLAMRTRARQLIATDTRIATFVEHLNKAEKAMVPAAERLGEIELEQAILPEQEALQHLLRAEAVFTDINISAQGRGRGGRGGRAGRDLTEMFELEMDLEKNQYESGSRATPDPPREQLDEVQDELAELARRQERLSRNLARNETLTPAQKWQQEMLRRDVEELQDRLERMQQQSAAIPSGDRSGAEAPGASVGSATAGEGGELRRRLESAMRAMNEANEAMRDSADREQLQRASEEARRQLEGARDRAAEEQRQSMQASLAELENRAEEIYETQSGLEQQLEESIRKLLLDGSDSEQFGSGMTRQEEYNLAQEKRKLQAELQSLDQDVRTEARYLRDNEPRAADQLEEAVAELREMRIDTRIAVAAAYIEQGGAIYIAASESAVTEALRRLRENLGRAEDITSGSDGDPSRADQNRLTNTLAEIRQLRRSLQEWSEANAANGSFVYGDRGDLQRPTGSRSDDPDPGREFATQTDNVSQDVIDILRELRAAGVTVQDIDELRRLASELRAADFDGNQEILVRESRLALTLVEQLELALAGIERQTNANIRTPQASEIPDAHKQVVSEYYRRLGEAEQ